MIPDIFLITASIIAVIVGGYLFVEAALWTSERLRVPTFIIGATLVSLATALPELIISVLYTQSGSYMIAVGNALGSGLTNLGLILAAAVLIMPASDKRQNLLYKSLLLVGALAVTLVFSLGGTFGVVPAILLILIFVGFMTLNVIDAKRADAYLPSLHTRVTGKEITLNIVKFGVGAIGLMVGTTLLINELSSPLLSLSASEGFVSVTAFAIITSLPELTVMVISLCKRQPYLTIGNVLGASVINATFIVPLCAFISGGLPVAPQSLILDLPFAILLSLVAFILPSRKRKFARYVGGILLSIYILYIIFSACFFA